MSSSGSVERISSRPTPIATSAQAGRRVQPWHRLAAKAPLPRRTADESIAAACPRTAMSTVCSRAMPISAPTAPSTSARFPARAPRSISRARCATTSPISRSRARAARRLPHRVEARRAGGLSFRCRQRAVDPPQLAQGRRGTRPRGRGPGRRRRASGDRGPTRGRPLAAS